MLRLCIALVALIALTACEKNIDIRTQDNGPKLVVDAYIENDQPPIVVLSRSLNYYTEIVADSLEASFVRNAEVTISDGSKTYRLREFSIDTSVVQIFFYTADPSDPDNFLTGKFNTRYTLSIKVDGTEYTATSSIPAITTGVDSLWWKPAPDNPDTSLVVVRARITDPKGLGNLVRVSTKVNDEPFYPGIASVFDDDVVDGTTYDVIITRGIDRNEDRDDDDEFFERGDSVIVKFSNIDRSTYDFWRTFEYAYQSIGNPFASPTVVQGNVSGGALGYFGGYASQFKTILIPE